MNHLNSLTLSLLMACGATAASMAAVPAGYYDSLEGKSGVELKKAVKAIIAEHKVIHYGEDTEANAFAPAEIGTWSVFKQSDIRDVDGHSCWWDMYSANNIWVSDGHPGLNIEHSVANSWWGGQSGSKEAFNDLHHLNPSNSEANNQKSNWPLGEIEGSPYWTNGVTSTGTPKSGLGDGSQRVFEPYKTYKGDFARAYFYIFTIYDDIPWKDESAWMFNAADPLTLKSWASDMLLGWAAADPVSQKEVSRNEAVYTFQGNRNPFIDCPQLADHIWGAKKNEPFHYTLYTPGPDAADSYPGWDETFSEMTKGQWIPIESDAELDDGTDFYIISPTKNRAMTFSLVSTGKAINECTFSPLRELETYPEVITGLPLDIATVRLEQEGDDWYVGVYDDNKKFCGYINVKTKNNAVFSAKKEETCKARISVDPEKTSIIYTLSDGDYTLQYNSGTPRFAAYTSTQNPIRLYRVSDEVYADPDPTPNPDNGVGEVTVDDAPEAVTAIYDINGRKVNSLSTESLERGVYIVVTNYGTKKIRK